MMKKGEIVHVGAEGQDEWPPPKCNQKGWWRPTILWGQLLLLGRRSALFRSPGTGRRDGLFRRGQQEKKVGRGYPIGWKYD